MFSSLGVWAGDSQPAMSDDKTKTGPADKSKVNVHEDYEVRYWSKKWGVTADQLKAAVKAVGFSASAVEAHLKKKRSETEQTSWLPRKAPTGVC